MSAFTKALALLAFVFVEFCESGSLKPCVDPPRTKIYDKPCDKSVDVPTQICHANDDTCSSPSGTNVCSFITDAIFADYTVFDAVIFHAGTCAADASIEQGSFTMKDAWKILPSNYELIGMKIHGSDLLQTLEDGIKEYLTNNGSKDGYPHSSGLRYEIDPSNQSVQNRISNAQILTPMCTWKDVELHKEYTILTNSVLAKGEYGYKGFKKAYQFNARVGVTEALWRFATSVCKLEDRTTRVSPRRSRNAPRHNFINNEIEVPVEGKTTTKTVTSIA